MLSRSLFCRRTTTLSILALARCRCACESSVVLVPVAHRTMPGGCQGGQRLSPDEGMAREPGLRISTTSLIAARALRSCRRGADVRERLEATGSERKWSERRRGERETAEGPGCSGRRGEWGRMVGHVTRSDGRGHRLDLGAAAGAELLPAVRPSRASLCQLSADSFPSWLIRSASARR